MTVHESAPPTRPLITLLTDTISELTHLLQTEIRLARAELSEKLSRLASSGALIGAGAVVMLPTIFILLLAIVRWLAVAGLPEQWGLTIVGIVAAAIAAALLIKGISDLKRSTPVPNRTLEQIRADTAVMKEHVT